MTDYLSAEDLVGINGEHGGPAAGVANFDGIAASADRPSAGFGSYEEYPDIWAKAGVLLHGIASTQNFIDGNKRTAWIATKLFLQINGVQLRNLSDIVRETFVLTAATQLINAAESAEWLRENRLTAADRVEHAVLSFIDDVETMDADTLYHQFPAQIMGHYESPVIIRYGLNVRLSWAEIDAGQTKEVFVTFNFDEGEPRILLDRSIIAVSEEVQRVPIAEWAPQGLQGWSPIFILTLGVLGSFDGYVSLSIDGETAWRNHISFTVDAGLREQHAPR